MRICHFHLDRVDGFFEMQYLPEDGQDTGIQEDEDIKAFAGDAYGIPGCWDDYLLNSISSFFKNSLNYDQESKTIISTTIVRDRTQHESRRG